MQILDKDSIQREICQINITLDPYMVQEVYKFLSKFIGPLSQPDAQYNIPATCAIMGQTIKIPTIDKTTFTSTGIKIENVMRHIGSLSKQKFLETIQTQLKKSYLSNHSLIQKVNNIKISFRIFKKYKAMFQNLSGKVKIPRYVVDELLAFFWIIYLITKQKLDALQNLNLSTKILVILIQEVFCNYFGQQNRSTIKNYITQKDNFAQLSNINQQQQAYLKNQVYQIVNNTIKNRDASASPNCNTLLSNVVLLSRLVDDLSIIYEKLYLSLPEGRFIDQMTYLQLSKNLTPQAVIPKNNGQPISKVINFDEEDSQNDESLESNNHGQMNDQFHTEDKKPNFIQMGSNSKSISTNLFFGQDFQKAQKTNSDSKLKLSKSMIDFTPVSLGQTKSTWAETFVENYDRFIEPEMRRYFQSKNIRFEDFAKQVKHKISTQIETLTKHITNKDRSINQSLKMCLTFAAQLLSKKPDLEIYSQQVLAPLLSISLYLYNQTTRYLPLELQKYAQIYNADLLSCLKILYDISENVNLPLVIKQTLSQLEKQVLIKQMWDTDRGYLLLIEGKNASNQIIFTRLYRRIYDRIKEICSATKVDLVEVQKIEALVKQILVKKPQIFQKNKLDQIIICSISACLNLNEAKYNLAISSIFSKYNNSVSLSLNSNQQIAGHNLQQGVPKTLLEFYNNVFIHEVQDMMSRQENPKYLYTPIRENHLRKLKEQSSSFPPVSRFLGSCDSRTAFGGGQSGLAKYQKQIISKMKETDKKQQQCESPYFGTGTQNSSVPSLKRRITFGDMGPN